MTPTLTLTARARVFVVALIALALFCTAPTFTQNQRPVKRHGLWNGRLIVDDEVLVKFREQQQPSQLASVSAFVESDDSERLGRRGLRRMHSRRHDAASLIALLRDDPDVEYVEPNYVLFATVTPNDTRFGNLWGLSNPNGIDIDAVSAWDYTTGSRANVVGVIDSGVDYTHPDLLANMWSAPTQFTVSLGGQNIVCAAGTHGFNAITRTCDPMDDNNHGTHVAGTIGGVGNNGVGVAGVNWIASMMGLKFLGSNGRGNTSDAILTIEFAIQAKTFFGNAANVRILSNSWGGGGYSQALYDSVNNSNTAGMLFVAAAGNDASNNDAVASYPANYATANMVAVAATDSNDQIASFSNYGATRVHLGAPGVGIVSTTTGNTYSSFNGTSMATPHVSGAAALVLSACSSLTTSSLRSAILNTVDITAAMTGRTTTGGRLNVNRALGSCMNPVTSVTLAADRAAPQNPGTTITWTATPAGGTGPYQYRWFVYDGSTWATQGAWTTSSTFAWTPTVPNAAYSIGVWARSAGNTTDPGDVNATRAFAISGVSSVTLAADKTAPQGPGTTITFTATPTGGAAPRQYKWLVYDGTTWTTAANWSTSNTFAWTPPTTNTGYYVGVWVRSAGNTADAPDTAGATTAIPFAIATATRVTLAANRTAPQPPGTTVTFTATATLGTAPYQYKWLVYDGTTWSVVANWSTSSTYAWTPTSSNANWRVGVWVRSAGNTTDTLESATASANRIFAIDGVTQVTLSANRTAPQAPGTAVTWTATASGGTGPLQYKWLFYDGAAWTVLANWSTSNTFAWTPTAANGNGRVGVWARSAGNAADASEASTSSAFAIQNNARVSLAVNKTAPQAPNTTMTFTATPSGGTAPYQYKWLVYDGATWTAIGAWTTNATYAWTPASANASWQVGVWVRSAGNTVDAPETPGSSTARAFAITAVTGVSLTANRSAPQSPGTTITWTATPAGGVGPFQYKWLVFDGASWTTAASWSSTNTFAWTPSAANPGAYVGVWVRAVGSTVDAPETTAASRAIAFAIQ